MPASFTNSVTAAATAQELTFALAPTSVAVYMDGGATPIATGTVLAGTTTATLSTDGKTTIPDGNHEFVVKQSIPTSAMSLLADWGSGSSGPYPGATYSVPATSLSSPASAGTALSIGVAVPPRT